MRKAGIGLQNFPEGAAVSMPLRREGMSRRKSFMYGQLSGAVEPVAGVLGALFVLSMQNILPFALCFAAGAMIFVVVEELIPESQRNPVNIDLVTMTTLVGFTVMMILDVALGYTNSAFQAHTKYQCRLMKASGLPGSFSSSLKKN